MTDDVWSQWQAEPGEGGSPLVYEVGSAMVFVNYAKRVAFVPWAGPAQRYVLPQDYSVLVEDWALPYAVELGMHVEDGRPMCVALTVHHQVRRHTVIHAERMVRPQHHYTWASHPLTATGLREIPLARLVRLAILAALHRPPPRRGRPRPRDPEADPPALEEWAELYAHETVAARRSRPRLDDDHFRDVAGIYRSALGDGLDPVAQVKAAFSVARSTAGRWVVEARKRGHLGPTTRGKAGELRPPKASRRRKASGRGRTR